MLESIKNDTLEYRKMSPDEMKAHGILGRLTGVCCDTIRPTRNERLYSEQLWEKVFDSPLVKEQYEAGGIFGELTHPDRDEVALEKVAIVMPNPPQKNKDGYLEGVWDILDTPCGRILKTLCDYGYAVGISTRGNGDIETDYEGNECVVPESYMLNAMDIVTIPAVKKARLKYITESVSNTQSLNESLSALVENSTDDDKKIIEETLNELNIQYQSTADAIASASVDDALDIDAKNESTAANDDGAGVIKDLQEALKENQLLQSKIAKLQESISVCYAKETETKELNEKYNTSIKQLSEMIKTTDSLKKRVSLMSQKVDEQTKALEDKDRELSMLHERLKSNISKNIQAKKSLSENLSSKDSELETLKGEIKRLKESAKGAEKENTARLIKLQEQLEESKKDSAIKLSDYNKKLTRANELTEKYKSIAKNAVDKYINSQAVRLGISSQEIKNKLTAGYTFNDIDRVCEDLQKFKVNMSKLPFDVSASQKIKAKVTESKEPILPTTGMDDEVDDSLIDLASNILSK